MIVPMTRYTFITHTAETSAFMEQLRELGLVDITTIKSWRGDEKQEALYSRSSRYMSIAKAMKSYRKDSSEKPYDTIEEAVKVWENAVEKNTALEAKISKAEEDLKDLEVWGDFDKKVVEELKKSGIYLHFFVTAQKDYFSAWEQIYPIQIVERKEGKVYFVIPGEKQNETFDIKATEVRTPEMSYSDKQAQIEELIKEEKALQSELSKASLSAGDIKNQAINDLDLYNFDKTIAAGEDAVEGHIKVYEGWSEKSTEEKIIAFFDDQSVVYFKEDAKIENNPPIKLKNNSYARLFEPVGRLYMNPAYNEIDLTPFFAPFFMIFFGMCFGDAGYGLLFILAIVLLWKKIPSQFKDYAKLVLWLAGAGILFGAISGNICGIPVIDKIKEHCDNGTYEKCRQLMFLTDPINSFYFSIVLGVIQVLFGQILRIFNRIKRGGSFVYGLSSIGWCLLFISSMAAYACDALEFNSQILGTGSVLYKSLLAIASILILFFANPKASIFASFGKGLYSVYEMATGIIGDLISYVRLFAIGLAGCIIAQVFNELSVGLSGDIIIVKQLIMAVILLIGHGLNIFVSSLGAFVHPVRLTFVEFYKNAEFVGGGRTFNPFRKTSNN